MTEERSTRVEAKVPVVSVEVPYLDAQLAGDERRVRELPGEPVVVPGGRMVAIVPMRMGPRGRPVPVGDASLVPGDELIGVIPINIP